MPTLIDELIVSLSLDPSKFTKGQQEAMKSLRKMQEQTDQHGKKGAAAANVIEAAFAQLQRRLLGITALFMGGLGIAHTTQEFAHLLNQVREMGTAFNYLGQRLSIPAPMLSKWEAIGARLGAPTGEMSASMARIKQTITQARITGSYGSLLQVYQALGITPDMLLNDPEQALRLMSKRQEQYKDKAYYSYLMGQTGLGPSMQSAVLLGQARLDSLMKWGDTVKMTKEETKAAAELTDAFGRLTATMEKLGAIIVDKLEKPLKDALDMISSWFDSFIHDKRPPVPPGMVRTGRGFVPAPAGSPSSGSSGGFWGWLTSPTTAGQHRSATGRMWNVPGSGSAARSSGTAAPGSQSMIYSGDKYARAKAAAADQLRKEGVPEANINAASSLLVGQAEAESNLNPNMSHDSGTGYGVYGARLGRRDRMLVWLKANGYTPNSLEGQMKYMAHEAMTKYPGARNALMAATPENMMSGTSVLTSQFESPAVDNSATRYGYARRALGVSIVDPWKNAKPGTIMDSIVPHPGLFTLSKAGNVSHNNVTRSTSINNMNIYSSGDDPYTHAMDVRRQLALTDEVYGATTGVS